jgi:hypothetical protein
VKPVLFLDVDGVISLFGFDPGGDLPGPFHWIDGIAHCIPPDSGPRLVRLAERYELVWATGWEEKANEYLPRILGLPFRELPCLTFDGRARFGSAHWKIEALTEYAGSRPAAWIDDNIAEEGRLWAQAREAPTLLVETLAPVGITDDHVVELLAWADALPAEAPPTGPEPGRRAARFSLTGRDARRWPRQARRGPGTRRHPM